MAVGTLNSIRSKIRRITGSSDPLQLPDVADSSDPNSVGIDDYINSFYLYDFPAQFRSLKLKDKYVFNTIFGVDTYAFNSERFTTVEQPCTCMKRDIALFNEPWSFYGANYNWQYQKNFATGDGTSGAYSGTTTGSPILRSVNNNSVPQSITGSITGASQATLCQITSPNHGLISGSQILITGVGGMTELNNNTYVITVTGTNTFTLNVNSTSYTLYTSGGTWTFSQSENYGTPNIMAVSQGAPAYQVSRAQNILITTNLSNGSTLNVTDDGFGNLIGDVDPSQPNGTINYATGAIAGLYFVSAVPSGQTIQIQYNQVTPSIPLSILYYQNQLVVRPVPDRGYTIELTAYRQPSQALTAIPAGEGTPELNEWWECIAVGASKKIFEDRLDMEGVACMDKMLQERYQVAYTRTYAQLGKQRIPTIYADQLSNNYGNAGFGYNSNF